jgi:hypothetical protein
MIDWLKARCKYIRVRTVLCNDATVVRFVVLLIEVVNSHAQSGQCILFSTVFTPSPPNQHGNVWVLNLSSLCS